VNLQVFQRFHNDALKESQIGNIKFHSKLGFAAVSDRIASAFFLCFFWNSLCDNLFHRIYLLWQFTVLGSDPSMLFPFQIIASSAPKMRNALDQNDLPHPIHRLNRTSASIPALVLSQYISRLFSYKDRIEIHIPRFRF
jgi:hypothetical protein